MRSVSFKQSLLFAPALLLCAVSGCKREAPPPSATASPSATPSVAPTASAPPTAAGLGVESRGVKRLEADVKKGDEFGYAVGIGGDRIAVSAYKRAAASGDDKPGSVFVYRRSGEVLSLETELLAEKSHQLGNALAFDGTTLVVGAMFDDGAAAETGAAYVATRGEAGWSKLSKLSAPGAKRDDSFGIGVALAGQTVIVTNTREVGGSLFTFEAAKAGFRLKKTLPFVEGNGPAETLSAHADVIAVGAESAGKLTEQGVVRLYARGPNGFAPGPVLTEAAPAENGHFGSEVAVGKSGIAVASEKQVSVFEQQDGRWQESAHFTPPLPTLAYAHMVMGDGVLVMGFPLEDDGRVLVYRKAGGGWKLERQLRAPDGEKEDWFGAAIALDGKRLVVGAPLKNSRAGAAYVVDL